MEDGFLSGLTSQIGDMDGEGKAQLAMTALKVVPAIIGFGQSNKAKKRQAEYLDEMKTIKESRQAPINPYANVTNPYANMQVATKAAEMQSEQADIALANTLDALRETGAGGATALAQAALKSKQGVSAEIQKQEVKNQQLMAQGEQRMQQLKASGANIAFQAQEQRNLTDLDRLQYGADLEAKRRAGSFSSGIGGLTSMAPGLAKAFINPGNGGNGVSGLDSGFDESQLYNSSSQDYSNLMDADLDSMIESDIPFGGFPD